MVRKMSASKSQQNDSQMVINRPRMPVSERAKIFMSFDALKGLREALAEREEKLGLVSHEVSHEYFDEEGIFDEAFEQDE